MRVSRADPSSRRRDCNSFGDQCGGVQGLYRWVESALQFRLALPPVIVIALDQYLRPFHPRDAAEVISGIVKAHCPARIAADQQKIVVPSRLLPGREHLQVVMAPMIAKAVHRFTSPALKVHVSYR